MGKIGSWLAGILATVIGGYVLWYLTKSPSPPPATNSTTQPGPTTAPAQPPTTAFEGMVFTGSSPVPNAMVVITLAGNGDKGGPYHDMTDANGSYLFDIQGLPTGAGATVVASKDGFAESQAEVVPMPLSQDNREDIPLMPLGAHPGGGGAHVPAAVPRPKYVRKDASQAARIEFQAKP